MKQKWLRRWHRRGALALAPFLLLQAFSGVFLSFGLYRRLASLLEKHAPPPMEGAWTFFMARLHIGPGVFGTAYHALLFLGVTWVICSGVLMWANRRRHLRSRKE